MTVLFIYLWCVPSIMLQVTEKRPQRIVTTPQTRVSEPLVPLSVRPSHALATQLAQIRPSSLRSGGWMGSPRHRAAPFKAKASVSAAPVPDTERSPTVWNFAPAKPRDQLLESDPLSGHQRWTMLLKSRSPCPKQPAAGDPALSVAPEIDRRGEIVAARGAARAVNGRPHQGPARAWNPLVAATNCTDIDPGVPVDAAPLPLSSERAKLLRGRHGRLECHLKHR